jgi:hypothetical protein
MVEPLTGPPASARGDAAVYPLCLGGTTKPRWRSFKRLSATIGDLHSATKRRVERSRQMCGTKAHLKWDDRLHAIPPLGGSLVAFISVFIVLTIVMR